MYVLFLFGKANTSRLAPSKKIYQSGKRTIPYQFGERPLCAVGNCPTEEGRRGCYYACIGTSGRKRMKASVQINDGGSTPAAGATESTSVACYKHQMVDSGVPGCDSSESAYYRAASPRAVRDCLWRVKFVTGLALGQLS
ncbi:hypothetical protein EVAR_26397_1 [Eumeta japonica]|uniref:Uncharacterized protein n=1 Tax=Eumeta variegata TaxID=151549 RepID=A0A4C1VSE6_EUMVA|nr:hypothetical protein EVAR_26397_1 [Eumeta japonica]